MWLDSSVHQFLYLAQTDRTIVKNDEVQGSMNSMSAGEILLPDRYHSHSFSNRELRRERVAKRKSSL